MRRVDRYGDDREKEGGRKRETDREGEEGGSETERQRD